MFCTDVPAPLWFIFSESVPSLLYYSHIPSAIIALFLGVFVYFRSDNRLVGRILLLVATMFFLWSASDLILWTNIDSRVVMSVWSVINLLEMFVSVGTLYFAFVFLEGRDTKLRCKLIAGIPLIAYMLFIPTSLNVPRFDIPNCEAQQGGLIYYFYAIEIFYFLWLLGYLIRRIVITSRDKRKITIAFSIGAIFFLASFTGANLLASLTEKWQILQYGLFGMPIFMAFLVYLIVKYEMFSIRLVGAYALVGGMLALIAAQFAFIQNPTNKILTAVTLAIVSVFGWWLAKSVKQVNEQNESLKRLNETVVKQKSKIERDKRIVEAANQELTRLDKAKSEFINIASHQLRTPISVIQGVASMMLDGDMEDMPKEQKQKFYESVWDKSRKLQNIVHDILNATSFDNAKFSVMDREADAISVADILQKIIKDFEIEAKERDLDLVYAQKGKIPLVRGQKEYLEEAFINLINNAIKYTPSSQMTKDIRATRSDGRRGRVEIIVGRDPKNSGSILVQVKDNGIGIPKGSVKKLFQKFSRAKNAVDMYTDGTGLGLYIIKEIVRGHRGKVWFESQEGEGTTFFVSLPTDASNVDVKKRIVQDALDNAHS